MDPVEFFAGLEVADAPRELVALGGTLEPATLVAAYRNGCFPWPSSADEDDAGNAATHQLASTRQVPVLAGTDGLVPWCSPQPRAVLIPRMLRVSRSLRRRLRTCGWQASVDVAFGQVMAGCADRDQTWITPRMQTAYTALHELGGAHSVEIWDGQHLVGGLYGVLTGAVFSGESMFHREPDASKVALVALVQRMREGGVRLLDTQQQTEHMMSLGQVALDRGDYVEVLRRWRDVPAGLPRGRRLVSELVGAPEQHQTAVVC